MQHKDSLRLAESGGLGFRVVGTMVYFGFMALLLSLAAPDVGSFWTILGFAEAIGLANIAIYTLVQRIQWIQRLHPLLELTLLVLVAVPTAFMAGHAMVHTMMGEHTRFVGDGPTSLVPVLAHAYTSTLLLYFLWSRKQFAKSVIQRADAQRDALEFQLRMLRAQIEPHMLFNTLANLRLLVNEEPKQAQRMIDQLIVYLRGALAGSRTRSITLRDEFSQLRAYLDIMAVRMGSRLSFRLNLPAELAEARVPPMLFQPLVENAIKHGAEPKIGETHIEVTAIRHASALEVLVIDSGLGLPPDGLEGQPADTSYGLTHVRERLLTEYGPGASLKLTRRAPQGVIASVKIPL